MTFRERRALMCGVAILAIAAGLRVAAWTIRKSKALRDTADAQVTTLRRAGHVLADTMAVQDSLAPALARLIATAPLLLEGGTSAEAAAALTSVLAVEARDHGLRVVRLDAMPDSGQGFFGTARARLAAEGDIHGVAAFVRSVETRRLLLSIASFSVLAPEATSADKPEVLRLELVVSGLFKRDPEGTRS